ncbi:transport permease protein [Planobispora rosea]|uniref:Transport permease protein n=1 Tax=Planobispora rosea TaxID=35762 RepID=A0A8J3WE85_PLARO|nr:ABC transporter permease [Planobispora rosea]GGS78086.1 transport permease protein [Planobispora rosea]GIH85637.1 transport permease protein [Planobispora rosea]
MSERVTLPSVTEERPPRPAPDRFARAEPGRALRLGLVRTGLETRMFFREKDQIAFVFSIAVVMLVILASIFTTRYRGLDVTVSQVYAAGLIGTGIMAVSFQNLGISIAVERDLGGLRRLVATPMPPSAYFIGKVGSVFIVAVIQIAILLGIGVAFFDLELPSAIGPWLTFVWVFVLGLASMTMLGIAASSVPRSARSATAVITLPFVVLQFVSGAFIPHTDLPDWLLNLSAVFPLKWLCQGMRSVFLGEEAAVLELTGDYELGRVALVLAAWTVGGLVLCLLTFRWKDNRTK